MSQINGQTPVFNENKCNLRIQSYEIVEAEYPADTYAIEHNMESYILKTKDFILNNADIHKPYKLRMKKFYLSPEEIMDIIDKRDTQAIEADSIVH